MVEEGALQPQADRIALGGELLGGGLGPQRQGPGLAGGAARIEQQPAQAQPHRPVVAAGVLHRQHRGAAAAAIAAIDVVHRAVAATAARLGEQRQLRQQAGGCGIPLACQRLPRRQQRLQFGVAAIRRQQAGLQIQRPARHRRDRIGGAGRELRRQVQQHRQAAAGDGPIRHRLDQDLLIARFDRLAPQHIQSRHQPGDLEVERIAQDHQVVAHRRVLDAHVLIGLLQLVVGLAHLQLQQPQLVGVAVAGGRQPRPRRLHGRGAGEVDQGVIELQAGEALGGEAVEIGPAAVGHIEGPIHRLAIGGPQAVGVEIRAEPVHAAGRGVEVVAALVAAAVGHGADPRPPGAQAGLQLRQGRRHLQPLALQRGAAGEGDRQGLLQADRPDPGRALVQVGCGGQAQRRWGDSRARRQRATGGRIRGLQAGGQGRRRHQLRLAGAGAGAGFRWDQGIEGAQLLIQLPPAALQRGGAGPRRAQPARRRLGQQRAALHCQQQRGDQPAGAASTLHAQPDSC